MTDLQAKYQKLATEYSKVSYAVHFATQFVMFSGRFPGPLVEIKIITKWLYLRRLKGKWRRYVYGTFSAYALKIQTTEPKKRFAL